MSSTSHEHAISVKRVSADRCGLDIASLEGNTKVSPAYIKLKHSIAEAKKRERQVVKDMEDRAKMVPKIQKTPAILREQKPGKYFDPRWISIGPIHHEKPKLKLAETQFKTELTGKFISDSGSEVEEVYAAIRQRIGELRTYFEEDVVRGYDDDVLSWMLFLDGCTVLQFINSYMKNELRAFSIKNEHIAYAQQDLFLLENQIPLKVLKVLMGASKKSDELKMSVTNFVWYNVMTPDKYKKHLEIEIDVDPEPAHLLELLRLAIIQPPKASGGRFGFKGCLPVKKEATEQGQQSFRSVLDLVTAGIELKPSETCSLKDITFTSLCFAGWLKLPPITVDDSTGQRFLNLVAYEMCPDNFRTNYEVTSYVSLLDSLIDYAIDVKELRSGRVLLNLLGCDKEVAQLFNEIATDLVPSPVYNSVLARIESHYTSKWRTWMAQVYHEHFRTPWTIVAFLAAVVALGMSGVQTYYTVHPKQDP